MTRRCGTAQIAGVIRKAIEDGHVVDIEGLGTFRADADGMKFVPAMGPRIFLAYVREDSEAVRRLFKDLQAAGYQPWMDKESLLPGQNWPRAIERAIDVSDFFIPCFSRRAVLKRGGFQSELRYALDCASRLPLDDIFVVPARLDDCQLPHRVESLLQHVDMFPDWGTGMEQIRRTVDQEVTRRMRARLPLAS
jgi:hypothetical protein